MYIAFPAEQRHRWFVLDNNVLPPKKVSIHNNWKDANDEALALNEVMQNGSEA